MPSPDSLGETLRSAIAVPTDTMITLDLPLLLTRLSQIPATSRPDAERSPQPGLPTLPTE